MTFSSSWIFLFIFSLQKFACNVFRYSLLCMYPSGAPLRFLNLRVTGLYQFCVILSYSLFKYCFCLITCLLSFGTLPACVLVYTPHVLCSAVLIPSLLCFGVDTSQLVFLGVHHCLLCTACFQCLCCISVSNIVFLVFECLFDLILFFGLSILNLFILLSTLKILFNILYIVISGSLCANSNTGSSESAYTG